MKIKYNCVFIFLIICLPELVHSATYYVDVVNGSNTKDGKTKDRAFKTIQKAADVMIAGDQCLVSPGNYDERVQITKSGNSEAPIIFESEGSVINHGFTIKADYIHIIGFEITDTVDEWANGSGIHLQGKNCELIGNYIHNVTRVGINVYAENEDSPSTSTCIIKNNIVKRAGTAGITIAGRKHMIENNDISHTLQYPSKRTAPRDYADADGIRFFGSGHVFRKNYIHDITMKDIENVDPHIDCFQTWGIAYDIIFEQNFCDNPNDRMQGFMVEEQKAPVKNIIIKNNIIKAFRAINFINSENTLVLNNTFKSEIYYKGEGAYGIELKGCPNSKVINNVFYDVGRSRYPYLYKDSISEFGLKVGYNCYYISSGNEPAGVPFKNDLWQVNPQLKNILNDDFHLMPDSPLIDMGLTILDVTLDLDDTVRPQGNAYDIGAFEFIDNKTVSPPKNLKISTTNTDQ